MMVYLVPADATRHELYCEANAAPAAGTTAREGTLWRRLVDGFRRMVEEGEAEREGRTEGQKRGPLRRWITRRVAEAVAEQRLLWHLRDETAVTLVHPDDVPAERALAISRELLASDYAKHRRWCGIDALIAAITGPVFFFVPGPNVISWYFAFRAVGHFFAMRGAKQGLSAVSWSCQPSQHLTELRSALVLDGEARARLVDAVAAKLGLDRLPFFIERIA
jgi:hypothetical protein